VIKDLRAADPDSVGPYRLLGRLGTGGMGQVYLARSPGGRLVAIKLIRPELAEERGFRSRFASEVAAARNVSGLFTAGVVDADPEAELPWMATVYVPGPSLADAVEDEGPLPLKSVLSLAAGLAEALVAIHGVGLVHRDLKPSNVLLAADGPRVIDFGISRAAERSMLTTTGVILGSPGFMSPEQAQGTRQIGRPSDMFSLGAVLVYAATGNGPFGGGPTPALLYRVVNQDPDLDQVPPRIRPLIQRCLAKDPASRPTPADLLDELGDVAGVLLEEWLPETVTKTIHRYVPTVPTPPDLVAAVPPEQTLPSAPSEPLPAEPRTETSDQLPEPALTPVETAEESETLAPPGAAPGIQLTEAFPKRGDISADITRGTQVGAVAAAEPPEPEGEVEPSAPAEPKSEPQPAPAPLAVSADDLSPVLPVPAVDRLRRRRWAVAATAAAVVIAVVGGLLAALSPGSPPKVAEGATGPVPSVIRTTAHLAATHAHTIAPSTTPASPKKKPAANSKRTHPAAKATTPQARVTTQPPPATTPPPATASPSPSTRLQTGPQEIASYSGASTVNCSQYGSVYSKSGGSGVSYSFVNDSDEGIQVWYFTSDGSSTPEATLGPGGSISPSVTTGQYWLVTNSAGGCISIFDINGSGEVVTS
jgi:eukaryotic-like serine/threonine-protein kinase